MKTIKFLFVIAMTSVMSFGLLSCSKDSYSSPLNGQTINDVIFDSSQGSDRISISNVADDNIKLSVISNESWCKADLRSSTIEVFVEANNSYDDRKAVVTITDSEDGTMLSFNVIQKQTNFLAADKSKYKVPEEGGSVSIEVKGNVSYIVEIPSYCTWLTLASNTRGLSNTTVVLNATKNDTGKDRSAIVILKNSEVGESDEVTIVQEIKQFFKIDPTEIEVSEKGGEIEVSIETNVEYTIDCGVSWISVGKKKEIDKNKYIQKLKVSELKGAAQRNAIVYFNVNTEKWSTTKSLYITQERGLFIDNSNVKINVGETYDLKLVNNTRSSVSWSSSNTSVATVDSKGLVKGIGAGKATITVKTKDGKYSDQIDVTVIGQAKEDDPSEEDNPSEDDDKDISEMMSHSFSSGWTSIVTSSGAFQGYFLDCTFKNNSKKDITLKYCKAYHGSEYIDTQDFNSTLKAGSSKTVKLTNQIGFNSSYTFKWVYEYGGKRYTYTCKYN